MEPVYKWEVTIGVQPSVQPGDRAVELAAATKLQALHRGNSARKQVQHEVAKFLERPTFRYGDTSTFHYGLLARFQGGLTRSALQEFEQNEPLDDGIGRWMNEYEYVVGLPAKEQYPASKGLAPNPELEPAFTRDKGRDGWTLKDFHDKQPAGQQGWGEEWLLSLAEVAILRLYTGPWFVAINFFLRYGPWIETCDDEAYHTHHDASRCFLPDPAREDYCWQCKERREAHYKQHLHSWATCAALLTSAIVKLGRLPTPTATATTHAGPIPDGPRVVYRGVKEDKLKLPESFYKKVNGSDPGGVELGLMSTTTNRAVAVDYTGSPGSLMEISLENSLHRGASVDFFSQYAAEQEVLFPPGDGSSSHGRGCVGWVTVSGIRWYNVSDCVLLFCRHGPLLQRG